MTNSKTALQKQSLHSSNSASLSRTGLSRLQSLCSTGTLACELPKRPPAQRGSVLVVCIGVLAIISLMAVVFITTMRTQQDIGTNLKYVSQAQMAVRSGLSHAISKLDQHARTPEPANPPFIAVGEDPTTDLADDWFAGFCYVGNGSPVTLCYSFDDSEGQNFDPYPTINDDPATAATEGIRVLNGVKVNFDGKAKWFDLSTDSVEGSHLTKDNKVKARYAVLTIDLSGRILAQPASWKSNTDYYFGQVIYGTYPNGDPIENREYVCTVVSGTSGGVGSEPKWAADAPEVDDPPITDNGVTWQCRFPIQAARLGALLPAARLKTDFSPWQPETKYKKYDVVYVTYGLDASGNPINDHHEYVCDIAGTSGALEDEPDWEGIAPDVGNTITDGGGTLQWRCQAPVETALLPTLRQGQRIDSEFGTDIARGKANIFKQDTYSWLHALNSFREGFTFSGREYPYTVTDVDFNEETPSLDDKYYSSYSSDLNSLQLNLTPFGEPLVAAAGKTSLAFGVININTAPRSIMNSMILNACGPLSRQVWQKNHPYEIGDVVRPSLDYPLGITGEYICTLAGTSGGGEPDWFDNGYGDERDDFGIVGDEIIETSGDRIIWRRLGSIWPEWEAGKDYYLGDIIRPRSVNTQVVDKTTDSTLSFICVDSTGTMVSGATEPVWKTAIDETSAPIVDNDIEWQAIQPLTIPGVEQLQPTVVDDSVSPYTIVNVGDGASPLCWRPGDYSKGDIVTPTSSPDFYYYRSIIPHTSATEPNWSSARNIGNIVSGAPWECVGICPPNWEPNTKYKVGDWVRPTTANNSDPTKNYDMYYKCENVADEGVSGNIDDEPVWPTTINATVDDGDVNPVEWTCKGVKNYHWQEGTSYADGQLIRLTDPDKQGYVYECIGGFTSSNTKPTNWPMRLGKSVYERPTTGTWQGEWEEGKSYNVGNCVLRPMTVDEKNADAFNPELVYYECTVGGTQGKASQPWSSTGFDGTGSYSENDIVRPVANGAPEGTRVYICKSILGTPGANEPGLADGNPWPLNGGETVTDGSGGTAVTWECIDNFWSTTVGDTFTDGGVTWQCKALPTWVCRGTPLGLPDRDKRLVDLEGKSYTVSGKDFNVDIAVALMETVDELTYRTGAGNYPLTGVSVLEDDAFVNKLGVEDDILNAYNSGWELGAGASWQTKVWVNATERVERAVNDVTNSLFYEDSPTARKKDYDGSETVGAINPSTDLVVWGANQPYGVGDLIRTDHNPRFIFKCVSEGTSGGTRPLWETINNLGEILVDPPASGAGAIAEGFDVGDIYTVGQLIVPDLSKPSNYYFKVIGVPLMPTATVAPEPSWEDASLNPLVPVVDDAGYYTYEPYKRAVWMCKRVNSVPALHNPTNVDTDKGVTSLAADESRTGEFWSGRSKYFYIRVRGETVRVSNDRVLSHQNCEAVVYVPDYVADPLAKPRILYQRWFVD